jgi:predicted nucleic acid-binding protein
MPGINTHSPIVADTDGLVALFHEEDSNHTDALLAMKIIQQKQIEIIIPASTVTELVTTFQRKFNKHSQLIHILETIQSGTLTISTTDSALINKACLLFSPEGSKQNTLFDALVVATAEQYKSSTIFGFDGWFKKKGYQTIPEIISY